MALPITPTPKLNVKESRQFLKKIERDLKIPAKLIPTPKLKEAEKFIDEYARNREK